jgi:hypothetical protein
MASAVQKVSARSAAHASHARAAMRRAVAYPSPRVEQASTPSRSATSATLPEIYGMVLEAMAS